MSAFRALGLRLRCLRKGHRYYPGRARHGVVTEVCDYCRRRRRRPATPELPARARVPRRSVSQPPPGSDAPTELVDSTALGPLLSLDPDEAEALALEPTFPAAAVRIPGGVRLWLRGDIEAFAAGRPVERQENVLRDDYLTLREVSKLIGVPALAGAADLPPPAIDVRSTRLWRRVEIDAWRESSRGAPRP